MKTEERKSERQERTERKTVKIEEDRRDRNETVKNLDPKPVELASK